MPEGLLTPALIAALLTAAGAPIASGVISAIIEFLKRSPLAGLVKGREKEASFVLAALVVIFALAVGILEEPKRYDVASPLAIVMTALAGLLAFYNIGRLAMAVYDDVTAAPNSLRT